VDTKTKRIFLIAEFVMLFILLPLLLFAMGTRLSIYLTLWGAGLYALVMLWRAPDFSWRKLWHGDGWVEADKRKALIRFIVLAILLAALTLYMLPQRFMTFPAQRFPLWCAVMVLYPLLSIVPQELFFRSFYFTRYSGIVTERLLGILINGLLFGFSHIVLNNWIAPSFCVIGGMIFAHSYRQHRSLKWAVIEHTLYGNWVFTVGIGWYFFTGNWRS
jgi:uncharacterized protein